ncbi:MAG TPA: hypothetical protein VLF39_01110 [Candidatus Saccharimonadales bacterium]|nr:hypothetical protein [Candidatus Saccharimonadales bacterium]
MSIWARGEWSGDPFVNNQKIEAQPVVVPSEEMDVDPDTMVLDYDPITGVTRTGSHQETIRSRWDVPHQAWQVGSVVGQSEIRVIPVEESAG